MNHPLDGVRQKIIRAEEHLTTIRSELELCLDQGSMASERDTKDDGLFHFAVICADPDLKLSVIIGECLHNLRSALDHIVWQLVLINSQVPIKENMFPICITPDGFQRQLSRQRLYGVSVQAQTIIERLQPYQGGQQVLTHPLWVLNELMNVDKHRTLALATVRATGAETQFINRAGHVVAWAKTESMARAGTDIPVRAAPHIGDPHEMNVQLKAKTFVAFEDDPVKDLEVNSIMNGVFKFVKYHVVPSFEPFF